MLEIVIPETELFDEQEGFIYLKETKLCLEHSLVSISKWEAKHHKPFLDKPEEKTDDEMLDYIKNMTITQNVRDEAYLCLTRDHMNQIANYINDSMTATWFSERKKPSSGREIITSELVYYWMVAFNIPFDPCQKWHINRLLTLIKICSLKQEQPEKMSKSSIRKNNAALNAARRAKLNSRG